MATLEGVNYGKVNSEPSLKVPKGELNAGVKILYDEHEFEADVNAIADVIKLGAKLPKGARVLDAVVLCPSLGTTGILSLGWAASDDAVESADADGLIVASQIDAGGQAALGKCTAASAGLGKKFEADVQIQAVLTEASDSALGETLKCWVYYVMD
jgi:hypothetical protein